MTNNKARLQYGAHWLGRPCSAGKHTQLFRVYCPLLLVRKEPAPTRGYLCSFQRPSVTGREQRQEKGRFLPV